MKKSIRTGLIKGFRTVTIRSLFIFLILCMASCSLIPSSLIPGSGQNNVTPETQEILIPVTRGSISSELSYVGNLQYNQSADMTWKTGGVIDKVNVQVGDQVKKGDVLAVLATDSLTPSVILAEKTMIEQQEKLEDVLDSASNQMQAYVTLNEKEKALIQAKLDQEALYYPRATREEMERAWDSFALAHLNFNYAKQDYDYLVSINEPWEGFEEPREIRFGRMSIVTGGDSRSGRERKFEDYVSAYNTLVSAYEKYVWTSGQPSATDYAVAEGNVEVAQMEYDKALEEYLSYENLPRAKDVFTAEASLKNAETNYNQRFIIAQFDGTVTSLSAVEGYYVTKGAAALRLDDKSRIFIPISIPELDISAVKNGTEVSIVLDAVSGKTYSGHIYTIADASAVSGNTTAFSAMVEVYDPDDKMLAGMTAEVSMEVDERNDVLLIPNTAVTYADGKSYVTVMNGEERQQLEIQLGAVSGNVSEVISGNLREDAQLVVSSISSAALIQLGLDPADYQGGGQQNMPERPSSGNMPNFPAGEDIPERPQSEPTAVPDAEAAETSVPTEKPVNPKEPVKTAAPTVKPTNTKEPESTAVSAPTAESKPDRSAPDNAFPFQGGQPPEMGDGQFPMPPEGGSFGNGGFPMPPDGQRPGGDGSGFPQPPGGQRPDRSGTGPSTQPGMTTVTPTADQTTSGEKG